MALNKWIGIGRLCADPELRQTSTGTTLTSFSIAIDRDYASKDGERHADFIRVTAWRNSADFVCKYFHKGDPIQIEGAIETHTYTDNTGANRTATEIRADRVSFVLGAKKQDSGVVADVALEPETGGSKPSFEQVMGSDGDLPF